MTTLERLALAVSARLSGDDLVLVLDYIEAMKRETRLDALNEALDVVVAEQGDWNVIEEVLREIIERERTHE